MGSFVFVVAAVVQGVFVVAAVVQGGQLPPPLEGRKVVGNRPVALGPYAVLGPFAVGKNEVDGVAHLGEHGEARWQVVDPGGDGFAVIGFFELPWQGLVEGVGREVLEWQAEVVTKFVLPKKTRIAVDDHLVAGDVYGGQDGGGFFDLDKGEHTVSARLRAVYRGRLRCVAEKPGMTVKPLYVPDWLRGEGFLSNLASLVVTTDRWLTNFTLTSQGPFTVALLQDDAIAPGQGFALRVALSTLLTEEDPCDGDLSREVSVTLRADGMTASTKFRCPCRNTGQSVVATFIDDDGSVQRAAMLRPRGATGLFFSTPATGLVLALHGTSVDPRDAADAFKVKEHDYEFGVENAYVIAPSRHGAHNWEGVGQRTAVAAVRFLETKIKTNKIIIVGHSMGAHGALLLASSHPKFRSRVVAVAAVAPWSTKVLYGDSNTRFTLDTHVHKVDPQLRAVLDASLVEHDVDRHAVNLCSLKTFIRVGSNDRAVHPWYARRSHRVISEACPHGDHRFQEVPGKDHWWWDTDEPNDGGCVNDPTMRSFYRDALLSDAENVEERLFVSNPAAMLGPTPRGYRILDQIVPMVQGSSLHLSDKITTRNVRRFEGPTGSLIIDGDVVQTTTAKKHLCFLDDTWTACEEEEEMPKVGARQVVESEFVIVAKDVHLGVYIANQFHMTGHARAPIVDDVSKTTKNVVLVGTGVGQQKWGDLEISSDGIRLGDCEWRNPSAAVLAVLPLGQRYALVLHGNSPAALETLVETFATPTIPPMARQPFSSDIPDVIILDAGRTRNEGVPGYDLTGYWDTYGRLAQRASWVSTCPPRRRPSSVHHHSSEL